jgi:hypothetical protein
MFHHSIKHLNFGHGRLKSDNSLTLLVGAAGNLALDHARAETLGPNLNVADRLIDLSSPDNKQWDFKCLGLDRRKWY